MSGPNAQALRAFYEALLDFLVAEKQGGSTNQRIGESAGCGQTGAFEGEVQEIELEAVA